ncbi:hypothetical protein MA16_Dca005381 [Dendrobium catenatum]|uniref:Uncharacterized protein n=1 Tax=Dendrobium catenatum TaxID=906689 RepID=A0A2I0X395_9ASPA|nr:hypothetical protein MA16_Dca005381 [Dendrobium catenatum]
MISYAWNEPITKNACPTPNVINDVLEANTFINSVDENLPRMEMLDKENLEGIDLLVVVPIISANKNCDHNSKCNVTSL